MKGRDALFAVLLLLVAPGIRPSALTGETAAESAVEGSYSTDVFPFIDKHCLDCHNEEKARGDFSLETYESTADVVGDPEVWELVAERLKAREMPPRRRPQPSPAEIDRVAGWIRRELARARDEGPVDPGRVTIRRLNRTEYSNTVRDLLGVGFDAREEFPSDDVGYGFDNIGDVLSLPPILLEKYLAAAERIAAEALKPGSESRKRLLVCDPPAEAEKGRIDACARKVLRRLATRAYRRPVRSQEVDRLVELVRLVRADGGKFDDGIRLALEAVLVSPHFLFRVELDPEPEDPGRIRELSDFELATRLSYFLWSSMPDGKLFALARRKALRKPEVLEEQVKRMLKDPKSLELVRNFGDQWLQVRRIETVAPDPERFPAFDEELRAAMLEETERFFETVMREDRSILEFLEADYAILNERLARHYGIEGVEGPEFRRVELGEGARGGVLTQASVLTATSNPTRTSPVKRGKWVLEVLLGKPPPPPPPDVPELSENPEVVLSGTLRERMEQHRADPSCATCHEGMDPLGFGLENFDPVGAWREKDGEFPIDASGELPDGRTFDGPGELKKILLEQKEAFRRAFVESLLTYALGRGLESYDRRAVAGIVKKLEESGDRFSALVLEIVRSDPFLKRRGDRGES